MFDGRPMFTRRDRGGHPSPPKRMYHARSVSVSIVILAALGCADNKPQAKGQSATAACSGAGPDQAGQIALAQCLATPILQEGPRTGPLAGPSRVVLYIDRSASMRGFLDPGYPAHDSHDYRAVIDRVAVGLNPTRGYSFGAGIEAIDPSLATLSRQSFYSDRDTKMQQALDSVARDTTESSSHVVIGDGRRGDASVAIAQFVRMRDVADKWISRGGTFAIATTLAPFKTVASDPSGCRTGTAAPGTQTCPLYAFAFIRPGEAATVAATLASGFEQVFTWPVLSIPAQDVLLEPAENPPSGLIFQPRWTLTADSGAIARISGNSPTRTLFHVNLRIANANTSLGHAYASTLSGQGATAFVTARNFAASALSLQWQQVAGASALVSTSGDGRVIGLGTRGPSGSTAIYRVDLIPSGEPTWLLDFDAKDATDVVRTYGLGLVFESFRAQAKREMGISGATESTRPLVRQYIVAN